MIGVIDYQAGNIRSVETALDFLGADYRIVCKPEELNTFDRILFPGVGEASSAMKYLSGLGMDTAIKEYAETGRPFLGICLGCQIVLETSEEGDTSCLGLMGGRSILFPKNLGLKVPHMGWNTVRFPNRHPLTAGLEQESSFYFVHSYYPQPEDTCVVLAETEYGIPFPCGFSSGNLAAFQFHPEKSGETGLKLLKNFLNWDPDKII